MFNINIIKQISILIVLCFSFFIFMLSVYMKKEDFLSRVLGLSFFGPLFLSVCSLFGGNTGLSEALFISAELLLLVTLLLLLAVKLKKKHLNLTILLIVLLPVAVFLLSFYIKQVQHFLSMPVNYVPIYGVVSLLIIYSVIKQKNIKKLLLWGVVLLLVSSAAGAYGHNYIMYYFALIVRFSAYTAFSTYFAHEFYKRLINRADKAEQKLSSLNKSLNHEVKKRVIEIERVNEQLVNMSKTDPLSSVLNKAAILDKMEKLISSGTNDEFSILMFDIDDFKNINDTYGHITGDKCIKRLALIGRESIRDIDEIGRYGGDEFLILVPGTNASQAKYIAERLRENVEKTESPHFTISIGIASYPADAENVKTLIEAADEAMYISKERGKNTISHKRIF